jgi:hypothetical protein
LSLQLVPTPSIQVPEELDNWVKRIIMQRRALLLPAAL